VSTATRHEGARAARPRFLLVVAGTGTEIGKTWVGARLATALREAGWTVAARKPVQSFDPADPTPTDAACLAEATGEAPERVCPPSRCYERALAPPMAAAVLGRPVPKLAELAAEVSDSWPRLAPDVGLVELAGGPRSPLAEDGDGVDLVAALAPDAVLLVADAALGTLNAIRLSADVLAPHPVHVHLNRYDPRDELHELNRRWLEEHAGLPLTTDVEALARALVSRLPGHCRHCGRAGCAGDCARPLDPPRFCPRCGRTLTVQVAPTGHRAECRVHGVLGSQRTDAQDG
jgi:dethiobiotin synthetase